MTMRTEKFAALILTHGRADNVVTVKTLRDCGYTGDIYLIIDDEDEQADRYKELYGSKVIVFEKERYLQLTDTGDTGGNRGVVVAARNAVFDIARSLGLDYFVELDDDYTYFRFRYEEDGHLRAKKIIDLDETFDLFVEFLDNSNALTVCFMQGGDFIGGAKGDKWRNRIIRKAMNAFFCRTDRPFEFFGRLNEDMTMSTVYGNRGELIMSVSNVCLIQGQTQKNSGGLTEAYLEFGTYLKSFYSVMFSPHTVKIKAMGLASKRIHHTVSWDTVAPMILNEKWRKIESGKSKDGPRS